MFLFPPRYSQLERDQRKHVEPESSGWQQQRPCAPRQAFVHSLEGQTVIRGLSPVAVSLLIDRNGECEQSMPGLPSQEPHCPPVFTGKAKMGLLVSWQAGHRGGWREACRPWKRHVPWEPSHCEISKIFSVVSSSLYPKSQISKIPFGKAMTLKKRFFKKKKKIFDLWRRYALEVGGGGCQSIKSIGSKFFFKGALSVFGTHCLKMGLWLF